MEYKVVSDIVERNFKSGTSQKTGKPWAIHKYSTQDGIEFTSFDDLVTGDQIVLEKNEYGYNGRKPKQSDKQHDEIMSALRKIYIKLEELSGKAPKTAQNAPKSVSQQVDEPFNLDDVFPE